MGKIDQEKRANRDSESWIKGEKTKNKQASKEQARETMRLSKRGEEANTQAKLCHQIAQWVPPLWTILCTTMCLVLIQKKGLESYFLFFIMLYFQGRPILKFSYFSNFF